MCDIKYVNFNSACKILYLIQVNDITVTSYTKDITFTQENM